MSAMGNKTTASAPAQPGWGIFWMILTGVQFVGVTALVKMLGTRIPSPEAAFLRYVLGLVFLLPLAGALWRERPPRETWSLFGLRGLAHAVAVGLWFYAMARIPIADVTAMNYL
ncbi:MAG: DMT family transporter, partial [Pseudomonadota bacterium]